jgi:hypothetical protein
MAEFNEMRRTHMIHQVVLGFALMLGAANVLLTLETLARL